jgi:hypothetical protein
MRLKPARKVICSVQRATILMTKDICYDHLQKAVGGALGKGKNLSST